MFPQLVGNGLYGRRLEGYWMDIGTPERYLQASWDILERRVETEPGERLDDRGSLIEDEVEIADGAEIAAPVDGRGPHDGRFRREARAEGRRRDRDARSASAR